MIEKYLIIININIYYILFYSQDNCSLGGPDWEVKYMKNGIVAIIIWVLLIGSTVFQIPGIKGFSDEIVFEEYNTTHGSNSPNKYAWSGEGYGLDSKGIISVVVPSYFPVYLSFSTRYEIYSPDNGMVELSTDGGNNWYPLDYVNGVQSEWIMRSVDISSFGGLPVLIRFRYTTGSFSTSGGWYVDIISVKDVIVEDFEEYDDGDSWGDWVIIEEIGELPPVVSITYPGSGNTVSYTIIITGEAHDPNGDTTLDWVMIKIDNDDWDYTDGTTSWSYMWDTTTVMDGTHIISAIASDGVLQSPVASVTVIVDNGGGPIDQPDLIITDIWNENNVIWYQVRNIGNSTAMSGHHSALYVDDEYMVSDIVNIALAPGERFTSYFNVNWDCTEFMVDIRVIADYNEDIDENNELNNQCDESWKCDTSNPKIIDGPRAQSVSQLSATIYWKTDENCDSTVRFDRYAGVYNNVVKDSGLATAHYVELTGLNPGTIYHFMVESMDASGNRVQSRDYYFTTSKVSDNVKPSLYPYLPDPLSGIVDISVDVSDNVGVDFVHFSCDDEPIFTMYSPPYDFGFYTGGLMDGEHDFGFDVVDDAGNGASESLRGAVMNEFPSDLRPPVNVTIIHPVEDGEYVLGDVIHIYARVESLIDLPLRNYLILKDGFILNSSRFHVIPCDDDIIIDRIDGCVDAGMNWISFFWDTRGYVPDGTTSIDIEAWDNKSNKGAARVEFTINIPPPDVQVFRDVERMGNYYDVKLEIVNNGDFTIENIRISDTNVGFQCDDFPSRMLPAGSVTVVGGAESFNEGRNSFGIGEYSQIQIIFPPIFNVDPGRNLQFVYHVVPVLYDCDPYASVAIEGLEWDEGTIKIPHVIGHKLIIEYDYVGEPHSLEKDDLRYDLTHNDDHSCENDVSFAFTNADYLIVTSPIKLERENPGMADDINHLLVTMVELARLKNGVFGYTWTDNPSKLYSYIEEFGEWWGKLNRDFRGRLSSRPLRFLLLVGEEEIIPSYRKGPFDINWDATKWVDNSDKPYSNIDPIDGRPDISVGRIIGNEPSDLINPIQASIDVRNNLNIFDRSNILLVSGTGEGMSTFQRNVDDIQSILVEKYWESEDFTLYRNIWKLHWGDYPGDEFNWFSNHTANRDIIFFRDHGLENEWNPGLVTNDASGLNFDSTKPFIYASACLTGDYEDSRENDDEGIAEAFFDSGAAVYIGSTEVSPRSQNNNAGKWFFRNWNTRDSIGMIFKNLKQNYYYNNEWYKFWCYEYNLYGDPKYGVMPRGMLGNNNDGSMHKPKNFDDPPTSLEIVIPDYKITSYHGIDYVEIPGGDILSGEEGRPEVPYYHISIEYPVGYRVQNVILSGKSGLITDIGLQLPTVIFNEYSESVEMKGDWYPEVDYKWRIENDGNESTNLIIIMYPFCYNPFTTMVKFYKNYEFTIEYIPTDLSITALFNDKEIYKPGDEIKTDLWIENFGEHKDFIVNLVLKEEISERILKGLLLKSLKDLKGVGSYSVTWNSPNNVSGSLILVATILDNAGNILDIKTDMIHLEIPSSLNIKSLSGGLSVTATVDNMGLDNLTDLTWSISIEGDMIIYGEYNEGIIQLLMPGDSIPIKTGLVLGFGPAEITINVAGVERTGSCFLFGPFVLGLS
jgi:hypothetical protein